MAANMGCQPLILHPPRGSIRPHETIPLVRVQTERDVLSGNRGSELLLSSLSASDKPTANMQITKIITTVVATACVSTAVPTAHEKEVQHEAPSVAKGNNFCGNGQVMSCCNTKEGNKGLDVLGELLGGNCSPLELNLLGSLVDAGSAAQACGDQKVQCCSGDQYGLINIQCTDLELF
ncbi:hypothetical protein V496_00207 [Pseudogymnoascus sp. VKM F-4515 (FW-2607)]|nr:hypothetical protein V496_00207 [Pseudogymnoascus sp. VKM F-4515 (FW-2607)]